MRPRAYEAPTGPVTVAQGTLLQLRTSEPVAQQASQGRHPGPVHRDPRRGRRRRAGDSPRRDRPWRRHRGQEGRPTDRQPGAGAQAHLARSGRAELSASTPTSSRSRGRVRAADSSAMRLAARCWARLSAALRAVAQAARSAPGQARPRARQLQQLLPGRASGFPPRRGWTSIWPLRSRSTPVSAQEAARLAQGLYSGGPTSTGGPAITPMASPYVGYPYGYPPVYYRPYYAVGGYYYWR